MRSGTRLKFRSLILFPLIAKRFRLIKAESKLMATLFQEFLNFEIEINIITS